MRDQISTKLMSEILTGKRQISSLSIWNGDGWNLDGKQSLILPLDNLLIINYLRVGKKKKKHMPHA